MDNCQADVVYSASAQGRFALLDEMIVERGDKADWDALEGLHYKETKLPAGSQYYRTMLGDQLIGVCILSPPTLLLRARHDLFPHLSPGGDSRLTNVHRANWLNGNLTRMSRIVTDTMFRGAGISYRMMNLAMRMSGKRFVEIQSSMSKFNPFDKKAGFKHVRPRQSATYESGFKFMRSLFAAHPADHGAIMTELSSMSPAAQRQVEAKLRNFYLKNSVRENTGTKKNRGLTKINTMTLVHIVKEVQQLVFSTPVYGIWQNPDLNRDLPPRLPMQAFDLQASHEPLRMDLL